MKQSLLAIGMLFGLLAAVASGQPKVEKAERPLYANVFLTVWQLENDHSDLMSKLDTPIPRVFTESWLSGSYHQDISDGRPHSRTYEKGTLRFELTAVKPDELDIRVREEGSLIFKSMHLRPSTLRTIFYDSHSRPYLLDVCFTCRSSPVGIFGVGPRKLF